MKIPKTTEDKPYIEFRIDKKGKIKLSTSETWWGGKNTHFTTTGGVEGNTCEPKDLKSYLEAFKKRKIKDIEKKIVSLQKQLQVVKDETERWHF